MDGEESNLHDLDKKKARDLFCDLKNINLTAAAKCFSKSNWKFSEPSDFINPRFWTEKVTQGLYVPKYPITDSDWKITGMKDKELNALNGYGMFILWEMLKVKKSWNTLSMITQALLEVDHYAMDEETSIDLNSLRLAVEYQEIATNWKERTTNLSEWGLLDDMSEESRNDRKKLIDKALLIEPKAESLLFDHLFFLYRNEIKEKLYDRSLNSLLKANPWLKYQIDKRSSEELMHIMISGPEKYFDDRKEAMEVEWMLDPMEALKKLDSKMDDAVDDLKTQQELLQKEGDDESLKKASQLQEVIHSLEHMTYEKKTLLQDFLWNTHIAIQRDDTWTSYWLWSSLTLPVLEASYGNFLSQINLIGAWIITKWADGWVTVMPQLWIQLANSITSADQKWWGFMAVDTGLIYDYNNKVFYAWGQVHFWWNYRLSDASDWVGWDAHEKVWMSLRGSSGAVIGSNASAFKVLWNVWKSLSSRTLDVHYARDKRQWLMDDLKMKEKRFATAIQEALLSDQELTHATLYEKVIAIFEIKSKDRAMGEQIAAFLLPEIQRKKLELDRLSDEVEEWGAEGEEEKKSPKVMKSKRLAQELANDLRRHVQNQFVDNLDQWIKNWHVSRASVGVWLSRWWVTPGVTWSYLTGKEYEWDSDDLKTIKQEIMEWSWHIMEVQPSTNFRASQLNTMLGIEWDGPKVESTFIARKGYVSFPEAFLRQDVARIVVPDGYKFEDYLVKHDWKLIIPEWMDMTIHETRVWWEAQYLICLWTKWTGESVTIINPYTTWNEEQEQWYRTTMLETSEQDLEAKLQAYTNEIIAVSKNWDVLESYNTDFDEKLRKVNKEFGDNAPFILERSTIAVDSEWAVTHTVAMLPQALTALMNWEHSWEVPIDLKTFIFDSVNNTVTFPQWYQINMWYSSVDGVWKWDIIAWESPNQLLQINYEVFDEKFRVNKTIDEYCPIDRKLPNELENVFKTTPFVQDVLLTIRYGKDPVPVRRAATSEYNDFLKDVAKWMDEDSYAYEKSKWILKKYLTPKMVWVKKNILDSWFNDPVVLETLVHKVSWSLSRVWPTEFTHLDGSQRLDKAKKLLEEVNITWTNKLEYLNILWEIIDTKWNKAELFEERKTDIEKLLTAMVWDQKNSRGEKINVIFSENNYLNDLYNTNNKKLTAIYRLAFLIVPDATVMEMRNKSYEERLKKTKWYEGNQLLQDLDMRLRKDVIQAARKQWAWWASKTWSTWVQSEICSPAIISRLEWSREVGKDGKIAWKLDLDPELVEWVEVSLNELGQASQEIKDEFRTVTLHELFDWRSKLVKTYVTSLGDAIEDITSLDWWKLKWLSIKRSKEIFDQVRSINDATGMIWFLEENRGEDRLGADILMKMDGPCRNYGKQIVTNVRWEQQIEKKLSPPQNSVQLDTQSVEVEQNVYYSVHAQWKVAYRKQKWLNLSFTADIGKKQETWWESITNPGIRWQIEEEINTSLENNPVGPINVNGTQRVGFEWPFIGVEWSYYFDETWLVHWDGGRNFRRVANITSLSDLTTRIANEVRTRKFSGDYYDTLTPEEQIFMKDNYKKLRTIRFPNRRRKRKETLRQLRFQIKQDKKDRKYKTDTPK